MHPEPTIGAREVLVFLAQPETLALDPDARAILAADDLAHIARLRFEHDREIAQASRALQRRALSSCTDVAPDAWRFVADNNGRPRIAAPAGAPALCFSVANTRGLVACAVSVAREVGLDVENWRDDAPAALIERCFGPDERTALASLPTAAQSRRFVELWTLKEAYIKARGLGLSLPLERISLTLDDGVPRLALDPSLDDDAASWQFALWSPNASHAAALCVRRGDGPPLTIDSRWLAR